MIKNTSLVVATVLLVFLNMALSQRSPYAGSRPTGYKDRFVNKTNVNTNDNEIVNRFGGPDLDATQRPPMQNVPIVYGEPPVNQVPQGGVQPLPFPIEGPLVFGNNNNLLPPLPPQQQPPRPDQPSKIPYDAYGDIDLVNRFSDVPVDHRPFWLINYQAIEAHRNRTSGNNFNTIASRSSFLGK